MCLVSNCAHIVGGSDPPKKFYNILYDLMEPKPVVQLLLLPHPPQYIKKGASALKRNGPYGL